MDPSVIVSIVACVVAVAAFFVQRGDHADDVHNADISNSLEALRSGFDQYKERCEDCEKLVAGLRADLARALARIAELESKAP